MKLKYHWHFKQKITYLCVPSVGAHTHWNLWHSVQNKPHASPAQTGAVQNACCYCNTFTTAESSINVNLKVWNTYGACFHSCFSMKTLFLHPYKDRLKWNYKNPFRSKSENKSAKLPTRQVKTFKRFLIVPQVTTGVQLESYFHVAVINTAWNRTSQAEHQNYFSSTKI